jgi:hypothetical protein
LLPLRRSEFVTSDRGVIEIEKHGKTNIVRLAKNIKETLVE